MIKYAIANEGFVGTAYKVREKPKDGCTYAIGNGHNILPTSEYMHKTITKPEARKLLIVDLIKHQKIAKDVFDKHVKGAKFDKLSQSQ